MLDRAREILAFLEKQHGPDPGPPAGPIRKVKTGRALQDSLFAALPDPLLDELRQVDPGRLAPEDALALIRKLRDLAGPLKKTLPTANILGRAVRHLARDSR